MFVVGCGCVVARVDVVVYVCVVDADDVACDAGCVVECDVCLCGWCLLLLC